MESNQIAGDSKKPRSPSIQTVFLVLVGLALFTAGGVVWTVYNNYSATARYNKKVQEIEEWKKKAEAERIKAEADAKLVSARNRQSEVTRQVRDATNLLERLLQDFGRVSSTAAALQTNEDGKKVGLHRELVVQAQRFYDSELRGLPNSEEITNKLESMRRIDLQIADAKGTIYEPESTISTSIQATALWAQQGLDKINHVQNLLASLVRESKIKVPTAGLTTNSPTLQAAIDQYRQAQAAFEQQTLATNELAAAANAILLRAQAESERIMAEAEAKASNKLAEAEEIRKQAKREALDVAGRSKIADENAKAKALQTAEEARKIALRQKASSPNVQSKLTPFTTPGYWLPGYKKVSYEKIPHSFSFLQTYGALASTQHGLDRLAEIAFNANDTLRPRWHFKGKNAHAWARNPDETEMVKEAQQLLIELGDTLVEMGLLAP